MPKYFLPSFEQFQLTDAVRNNSSRIMLDPARLTYSHTLRTFDIIVNPATEVAVFTIMISPPVEILSTVTFTTRESTAIANEDFVPKTGVLSFYPGEFKKYVEVPLLHNGGITVEFYLDIAWQVIKNNVVAVPSASCIIQNTE